MTNTIILLPTFSSQTKNYVSVARRLWTVSKNVFRENRIFWVPEKRYEVDTIGKNVEPEVVYNICEKLLNQTCKGKPYQNRAPFF